MANGDNVGTLSKKAFISTLVAIALNPVGIVVGYLVGQWLQGPKFSAEFVAVETPGQTLTVSQDLNNFFLETTGTPLDSRFTSEDREKIKAGNVDAQLARALQAQAKETEGLLISYQSAIRQNLDSVTGWRRGDELVLKPVFFAGFGGEAPQSIGNRDKAELLGIYKSALKDLDSRIDRLDSLIKEIDGFLASDASKKRTGESVIKVGILNSGGSEGVVYPKASLSFSLGQIKLVSRVPEFRNGIRQETNGGFVLVPPHSFRNIEMSLDSSTTIEAADKWKELLRARASEEVEVLVETSAGKLHVKGRTPL